MDITIFLTLKTESILYPSKDIQTDKDPIKCIRIRYSMRLYMLPHCHMQMVCIPSLAVIRAEALIISHICF